MNTVSDVMNFLRRSLRVEDSEAFLAAINSAHIRISRACPWQWLRRSTTISTTDDDTAGGILPADLIDILDPVTDSNDYEYWRAGQGQLSNPMNPDSRYWYFDDSAMTPLAQYKGVTIEEGAYKFTIDQTWDSDWVGEYIRFDSQPGIYLISGEKTISSSYHGPRLASKYYTIRPECTKRLSLKDGNGDRVDATATVSYWMMPKPFYHEWQLIDSTIFEPLKWGALLECEEVTVDRKTRPNFEQRYRDALSAAICANPAPAMVNYPRDRRGYVRTFGRRQ